MEWLWIHNNCFFLQAEDCDAFDSDVDEAPTAQTMFMANFSSADPITDEAEPSYDSDILSEAQENGVALDAEQLLFLAGGPDNAFDNDVDEQPVQDLALNMDNVFQAEDYNAFDSDVDEAPTAQTMFMANLSSADPIIDEAGPSYDSYILSEVQDHDQYLDDTCAYQEEHVMHDSVQLDHVVDLHADYTSVDNMIPYDQYVKDNEVPVVHRNASFV
nr:integrase, catalytic region, zinc finger, CCHC-type, peptidase aspartic, catalytic [Tanacetum cinerariifolium]